jgi:tripartite-type tricarboxylate transporter receptor subunit TctC
MFNAQAAAVNPGLYKKIPYNPDTAFAPISLVAELPLVLLVNASIPATTTKDFVALVKTKPAELTYSSAGNGSSTHPAALFENRLERSSCTCRTKGADPPCRT